MNREPQPASSAVPGVCSSPSIPIGLSGQLDGLWLIHRRRGEIHGGVTLDVT